MAGNASVGNMSEVSLLLYFWPRSETQMGVVWEVLLPVVR